MKKTETNHSKRLTDQRETQRDLAQTLKAWERRMRRTHTGSGRGTVWDILVAFADVFSLEIVAATQNVDGSANPVRSVEMLGRMQTLLAKFVEDNWGFWLPYALRKSAKREEAT